MVIKTTQLISWWICKMVEVIKTTRIRVNYDVSVKGVVTPSITVEMTDVPRSEVLIEATKLLDEALIIAKERSSQ